MKNLYSLLFICFATSFSFAQVAFTIVSPASISGGYEFTSNGDAPNWGLPNLNNPADAIQDTVIIYEDTTSGINAQGIPHANEGCAPAINSLTGKIALIYRYDGVSTNACYAGTKVLNAQNAGAIGVILVNREDGVYGYDGTTDGPFTNIPFAFIGKTDGAIIRAKIAAGEDVVAFIGNKLGLYGNDVGIVKKQTIAPSISATAALTTANASEFGFDVGTKIYNYGLNTQSNVSVTATVTGPGGTWTETAGPFTLAIGDSVDVFTGGINNLPAYSMPSYPVGNYTLDYSLQISSSDEFDFDNTLSYNFSINENKISFSKSDPITGLPIPSTYTRSQDPNFSACMVYHNQNGSRLGAEGVYFATQSGYNTGAILEDQEFGVSLYRWDDNFVDLDDVNFAFDNLTIVANGTYIFGPNQESIMVFAPFEIPVQLSDDQRYIACVNVWNDDFWIGFSNRIDYTRNVDHYLQPLAPVSSNSNYYALGFGSQMVPSIALRVFDAAQVGYDEFDSQKLSVFPNPVLDKMIIQGIFNPGLIRISDLSGRTVKETVSNESTIQLNVSDLENGQYNITVQSSNGSISTTRFTKI
jgi:hypothetical protein